MYKFSEEYNPLTGATESYYWDDASKTMTVRNRHDVTSILEANKRMANDSLDQRFGGEMLHHIAEIPNAIIEKWLKEDGIDVFSDDPTMQRAVMRKLHDPDWRYLRSTTKKVL